MRSSRTKTPLGSFLKLMAIFAALFLVAAACSDDDGGDDADGTDEPVEVQGDEASAEGESSGDDQADWPDKIVFAAVPSEESSALEQSYGPIIAVLEDELGVEIEFFQASDYAGVIEGMIAGNVDLAQFGPFSYVIAEANGAAIRPVGAMVDAPEEEPGYQSFGITQGDNDEINAIEDFAGHTVCFVDPGSTSGFLYPSAGLIEADIDPDADVTPTFAGGHDASAISVANGDCEAGFAFDSMVTELLIEDGTIQEGDLKVVWESEVIAGSPLAVRTELPQSLLDEIDRIIVELANNDYLLENGYCGDPDDAELRERGCELTDEAVWGYVAVDDTFYDGVRAVCAATRAESCEGVGS
jgi:phosphonate transport system substrate-binding protein